MSNRSKECRTCYLRSTAREKVLVNKRTRDRSNTLAKVRRVLLRDDLIPYQCADCGLGPEWCGKELVLELHHKNKNGYDNRVENLEFLCPNCHSTRHR
jgi:5-methylcytosine-specific restriction endonuclease McrA